MYKLFQIYNFNDISENNLMKRMIEVDNYFFKDQRLYSIINNKKLRNDMHAKY